MKGDELTALSTPARSRNHPATAPTLVSWASEGLTEVYVPIMEMPMVPVLAP